MTWTYQADPIYLADSYPYQVVEKMLEVVDHEAQDLGSDHQVLHKELEKVPLAAEESLEEENPRVVEMVDRQAYSAEEEYHPDLVLEYHLDQVERVGTAYRDHQELYQS